MVDLDEAVSHWRRDGWALLDGLIPADEIDVARVEIEGRDLDPPARLSNRPADEVLAREPAFREEQFSGTTLFPIPEAPDTNRLFVHPTLVAMARAMLGADDIRIYQSRLWSKFGGRTDYAQPLHRDLNHSLVPTRAEPGWWFLECFLYLNDVDEDNGAPSLVPLSADVNWPSTRRPVDREDAPVLYDSQVRAPGVRGSVLAYRSDVWHRGVDLAPGQERHILVVAFKPAGLEWIGFDAHPPLSINRDFVRFVDESTPDDLALFGVPRPGHPYWTAAGVDEFQRMYRGLDVEPWRQALVHNPTAQPSARGSEPPP